MKINRLEHKIAQSRFTILDHIPVGVCIIQQDMTVIFWNKCLEKWTNISRHQILNQKIYDFFPHLIKPKYYNRIQNIFKGSPATIFSSQLHKHIIPSPLSNGNLRIQHTIVTPIPHFKNDGYDGMIVIQDVTEASNLIKQHQEMRDKALKELNYRKKIEEDLSIKSKELQKRNLELTQLYKMSQLLQNCDDIEQAYSIIKTSAELLFDNLVGGFFFMDENGETIKIINCGNLDRNIAEKCLLIFKENKDLLSKFNSSQSQSFYYPLKAKEKDFGFIYFTSNDRQGISEGQKIFAINFAEQIALILANISLGKNLYKMSITDSLTGLYNRRYLDEILQREINIAQKNNELRSVIMIDIDYFKKINDTFGHDAGDLVLTIVSNLLLEKTRISDFVCRYGGEELTIVLSNTSIERTKERAEEIRQAIKQLNLVYNNQSLPNITASFGIACFPSHGLTPQAILLEADTALYQAKEQGRDRVIIASIR
ncbi:sensor domain-containing diguanylate cyclase [Geminocystis herdmanii]|uniref:sensor domain-containing diguanylate cyclase n=1 Tax=Geminocystis herdmanii TaxID=669359 RepID=UPI00058F7E8E|nr:diguanylate cyclase [Geminocystis herdmanii]